MTIETTPQTRGVARAVGAAFRDARTAETIGFLVAGFALRALRDERLFEELGAKGAATLVDREVPALDHVTGAWALRIVDAFGAHEIADLATLGVTKLAALTDAPAAAREELLATAQMLPSGLLRARIREANEAIEAETLRTGVAPTKASRSDPFVAPATFSGW